MTGLGHFRTWIETVVYVRFRG